MNFEKYHSLENDFIILDHKLESKVVRQLCNRHTGIGADGVLVVNNKKSDVLIFNSNGNQAETCLNGLRCVAHYLHTKHNFPTNFTLTMGNKTHHIEIHNSIIHTNIDYATYQEKITLNACDTTFECHLINVGNPHCVIFQKVSIEKLALFGPALEQHTYFPYKTNVEFIWHDDKLSEKNKTPTFRMLVYERDCGITRACSSGAVAAIKAISTNFKSEKPIISMPGGNLDCTVKNKTISIAAPAHHIFSGAIHVSLTQKTLSRKINSLNNQLRLKES